MEKSLLILLFLIGTLVIPFNVISQIGISITATIAPPELPEYSQPPCPVDGYLWTPGYWAYDDGDYYWVPGVWVSPPQPGFVWTPFYWGFESGIYGLHRGYWGREIGFYGGVNYGYGYGGSGFYGGRWEGNRFRYNTAVVNVNTTIIHNTYIDRTVIVNNPRPNDHRSFNGGEHGISTRPTLREQSVVKEHHIAPTHIQSSHEQAARHDKSQFASVNNGKPATTAVGRPSNFGHKNNPSPTTNTPTVPHGKEALTPHNQPTVTQPVKGGNNMTQKDHTGSPNKTTHQPTQINQHNNATQNVSENKPRNNQQPDRKSQIPVRKESQPVRPEQARPMLQPERQPQPIKQAQQPVRQQPKQQLRPQQAPHEVRPSQQEHGHR